MSIEFFRGAQYNKLFLSRAGQVFKARDRFIIWDLTQICDIKGKKLV